MPQRNKHFEISNLPQNIEKWYFHFYFSDFGGKDCFEFLDLSNEELEKILIL